MSATKGNQFWRLRSKHGRDKLFATPDLLWESACEYFEWCDENPWISSKRQTYDKGEFSGESLEEKPTQRPYSRTGFYLYIDCSETWLKEFKKVCDEDFLLVISRIEKVIDTNQWEGATVGAFNANIIARTLGLKDHSESTNVNINKEVKELSDEDIKRINKALEDEY